MDEQELREKLVRAEAALDAADRLMVRWVPYEVRSVWRREHWAALCGEEVVPIEPMPKG